MTKKLLLVSFLTLSLSACQTLDSGGRFSWKMAEASPPLAVSSSDIWVDLTPYEKKKNKEITSWSVTFRDGSIRQALSRWASDANWSLDYALTADIPIIAEATLVEQGTFKQGVQTLVDAMALSDYSILACFYPDNHLRVIDSGHSC